MVIDLREFLVGLGLSVPWLGVTLAKWNETTAPAWWLAIGTAITVVTLGGLGMALWRARV